MLIKFEFAIILLFENKQWWSTSHPISTKQTIASHLSWLNTKKTMTYDVGNPVPGLGQADSVGIGKIFVQISFILGNIRKTRGISQNVWSSIKTRAISQNI